MTVRYAWVTRAAPGYTVMRLVETESHWFAVDSPTDCVPAGLVPCAGREWRSPRYGARGVRAVEGKLTHHLPWPIRAMRVLCWQV